METRVSKSKNEKQTAFVVLFSAVTMVLEIVFGLFTHSMALLADGIHMGSHVLAIGLELGGLCICSPVAEKTDPHGRFRKDPLFIRLYERYLVARFCLADSCRGG